MKSNPSDRIEKQIFLEASRSRVWRALTDSREFGDWFEMQLDGPFAPGKTVSGKITFRGNEIAVALNVQRIEPEHHFSYRWHPYAVEPDVDYAAEPTTLVSFELSDQDRGTMLRIVESGFDQIPIARRAEAFRMNTGGWNGQAQNLEAYLAKTR